jgi:membrane protein YqaA with SNARE-associated domain
VHKVVLWLQHTVLPALGPFGMAVIAFFDSSFLSLPEVNDILVVTSSAARPRSAWLYVLMTTAGSVAGCVALREVGRRGGEALLVRKFGRERLERMRARFKKWDILCLAVPAVLPPPMPFKIFVLSAGVFGLPLRRFVVTIGLARAARYSLWGVMGAVYGQRGVELLRAFDRWFLDRAEWFGVGAAVLLVVVLAVWAVRRRRAPPAIGEAP